MIKSSKLFSGTASKIPSTTLHSTPVTSASPTPSKANSSTNFNQQNAQSLFSSARIEEFASSLSSVANKLPIVSIKPPILHKQLEIPNLFQDSVDLEVTSPSNSNQKVFSQYTGIVETEPSVILMSEFIPIFSSNQKSDQGKALSLKENSKIINAKTAINILSQSIDTKSFIKSNKEELSFYISKEDSFLNQLSNTTSKALEALDLSSYSIPSFATRDSIGSLYEILKRAGYSSENIAKFTESKLWNQSLVELKRSLLTHSPDLTSTKVNRKNTKTDSDPFELSDIENQPEGIKRIWLNPYSDLPSLQEVTSFEKIEDNITEMSRFDDKKYVNLSEINVTNNIKSKSLTAKVLNNLLGSYSDSGRDISIASNSVFKEAIYSVYILNPENSSNIEYKFGYRSSPVGDNLQLWDYVVGRFPKSILEFSKNPTGKGKSLSSFSQEIVSQGDDSYDVLTFENNVIEGSGITPGSNYYIDSSLTTQDGTSFDISRLDKLIGKTKEAHDTTKTIIDILGYNIQRNSNVSGVNEDYRRKYEGLVSLESLVDRFSNVATTYQKCMVISSADEINSLDASYMRTGFGLTTSESIGIRLVSLICKAAVYPTKNYERTSNKLKSLLFLWLLNVALKQLDPSIGNESTISDLKNRISSYFSSITVNTTGQEIIAASKEARTFPFSVGNSPDIGTYAESSNDTEAVREKKAALITYVQSVSSRIFQLDADKGLWSEIISIFKELLNVNFFFTGDYTGYSGISKIGYIFGYFDLILRVISSQTPENLLGSYSTSYEYSSSFKTITISETGFLISPVAKNQLNEIYNARYIKTGHKPKKYVKKLSDAISFLKSEDDSIIRQVAVFRKYLLDLGTSLNFFRTFLKNNFESHIASIKSLYDADDNLDKNQKVSLLNLSFSEEQIRLSRYVMSEIGDRIKESNDLEGKLKSIPSFTDFPVGFTEFLPINETDIISYTMLSPYFKSVEFLKEKGNNKKILSVGIPPRLNRNLRTILRSSSGGEKAIKQSLIKIKVYKLDRLHPDVVYLPKTYLFEMNRFPTRVISNWNYSSFIEDDFNLLNMPSKLVSPNGNISVHKDFTEAFPSNIYGNILLDEEKFHLYINHSISFLSEEYLRWFTDIHFDESRYNNFSNIKDSSTASEEQFKSYVNFAKKMSLGQDISQQVKARFTDPTSGETFDISVKSPNVDEKLASSTTSANTKSYVIPMDNTLLSYFENETFVTNVETIKRRMSYMKKFDRVFNVIFDPDDFYVDDSVSAKTTLESLKNLGMLVGGDQGTSKSSFPYKHRDTSPGDVTLDEYFVTIEPYDYAQQ